MRTVAEVLAAVMPARSTAAEPEPAVSPRFDADRVWMEVRCTPDPNGWMKFAGWLWRGGMRDMDAVALVVRRSVRRGPSNPYAYFSQHGEALLAAKMDASAQRHVAESEARALAGRRDREGRG